MTLQRLRAIRWGFVVALLAFWLAPIANDAAWARAFADPLSAAVICTDHDVQNSAAPAPHAPTAPHDCCQICAFAASAVAPPAPFFAFITVDRRAEGAAWAAPLQKVIFARWPGSSEARGPPGVVTP